MNDYTYTDFLVKKSVQPFSLRNLQGSVNQFQNLTLHINKKAFQIRQDSKDKLNTMQIIKSKKLQVQQLPDTDRYLKQITHARQLNWRNLLKDSEHKKIMQVISKDKYVDDVVVVSEGQKKSHNMTDYQVQLQKLKNEKAIWTVENKLKFVMDDKIKFEQIKKLHQQYVTEKLKKNFWEDRFKNDNQSPRNKSLTNSLYSDRSNRNFEEIMKNEQISKSEKKERNPNNYQIYNYGNVKEQCNEDDLTNSQLCLSKSQIKNEIDRKIMGEKKGSAEQEQNQSIGVKEQQQISIKQTLQHFLELDQNILPSKIQSNLTTQPNSQKYLKEINAEQKKIGKSLNSSYNQLNQHIKNNQNKIIKSNSIHAHFEADFDNQASFFEASNNQQGNIKQNLIKLEEEKQYSYSKVDSKLNFPHFQGNHKSMMNINPFDCEIFIQEEELNTERQSQDFNPGEKYEQLRKINSENEKKLIDYIIKKNQFELVDLFPSNVKIQPRKYVDFDQIQLSDFDKAAYQQQIIEKEKLKNKNNFNKPDLNNKHEQNFNLNKKYEKHQDEQMNQNKQSNTQLIHIPKSYQQSDQVIEPQVQLLKKSPLKKRKTNKNKIKSQCIQRLSKDTDQFSVQYLRKYGLEETTHLKDEFSKLRSTATTLPYSMKTDASKQNSQCSSPRNNPYLLNNKTQILNQSLNKKDLIKFANKEQIQINESTTTGFSNTAYGAGFLSSRSENRKNIRSNLENHEKSKQQIEIAPFFKKRQLSISQALKQDEGIQPQQNCQTLNNMFSPVSMVMSNKYTDRKHQDFKNTNLQIQQNQTNLKNNYLQDSSKQKNNQNQINKLLKFQKMIQEKQNNQQDNLQIKENFIKFYDNVLTQSKQQSKTTGKIKREINKLVKNVDKSLASIQSSEGPKLSAFHHEFRDFKEMKIFKRKLFNYAINKIHPDDRKGLFELYSMTHRQEVEDLFAQQMKK
ncbi:hypothetical protein TTHERM_00420810 (macronuclear) [Tetrahymena thermophila SB210]|uniref:Uncharacterized protein n=1 Tax=Tetrahymena thermophila (strain SB210) TaxID=312017 RepID=I7M6R2_TETTS|nr:hypothetical protein TTHERM_00420810 [Tetrahymena thermophila SB210]EAR85673.2 hypothetical protein TTHERM_00420810 [Tetrahymena thermophila SB210]|eukprot:XP_001033336.2 hypothetical protein TTHERM_00420810 [Tetrahymena thermophila SB210]